MAENGFDADTMKRKAENYMAPYDQHNKQSLISCITLPALPSLTHQKLNIAWELRLHIQACLNKASMALCPKGDQKHHFDRWYKQFNSFHVWKGLIKKEFNITTYARSHSIAFPTPSLWFLSIKSSAPAIYLYLTHISEIITRRTTFFIYSKSVITNAPLYHNPSLSLYLTTCAASKHVWSLHFWVDSDLCIPFPWITVMQISADVCLKQGLGLSVSSLPSFNRAVCACLSSVHTSFSLSLSPCLSEL